MEFLRPTTVFKGRDGILSGSTTADSLGLGDAKSFQYQVGYWYKRWQFALVDMPTTYTGQGFATTEIDFGTGTVIAVDTPISSDIDVRMTLLNVLWDAWSGDTWKFSVGFGLGQTKVDVHLIPDLGQGISFDGTEPFSYLALRYVTRSKFDYSNLNLMGGYLFHAGDKSKFDVVAGYRRIDFLFDYNVNDQRTRTDMTLKGPYIGIVGAF
jgi:hypothetical protein